MVSRKAKYYLKLHGPYTTSYRLKLRLFVEGIKQRRCEFCFLSKWLKKRIPLELHHINGQHKDNRLKNLQILCPNCHATTDTYCKQKKK